MSLFKRLLNPNYKPEEKAKKTEQSDQSSYYPEEKIPADEKFMMNFKNNGGKFIYCENWDEVLEAFDNVLLENDWYEQDVFCFSDQLTQRFDGFNLNFIRKPGAKFLLSTCEALIAHTGAIMLSSNQIKEKKLGDFPYHVVIFATTSQIVESLSEGLRIINSKRSGNIPSNISTIQHFEDKKEKEDFMSYGSSTKNLYLLLMEDL
ncbi:MAG TPA: LUD domain-containing protein [Flavobacteriaceae bacterium]|nr:LUD domain-containing protein [Flavobacteriaceae bacterium]